MALLDNKELEKLLENGPFLDEVEKVVSGSDNPAVRNAAVASVGLQRDAANAYADQPVEEPVTGERVKRILSLLYIAYEGTQHRRFLREFREMMTNLGIGPDISPEGSQKREPTP